MMLCLDVGNSQIFGGIFESGKLKLQFRKTSNATVSSDELGLFLRAVLRENGVESESIEHVGFCTVVPDMTHSLRNCFRKYFRKEPFVLQAGVKTGLKIKYKNPTEVGADRVANAVAAVQMFPERDLLIADFGTATTFCAVSANKEYLGGVIAAGLRISMEALESRTAKLPKVEIVEPSCVVGTDTIESIQSGLYYGHLGMVRELIQRISLESFGGKKPLVIGTGGFSRLFERSGIFDQIIPDLVLQGVYRALLLNGRE